MQHVKWNLAPLAMCAGLMVSWLGQGLLAQSDDTQTQASAGKLPSAEDVVDQFLESLGSEMELRSCKSMKVEGQGKLSLGMELEFTGYLQDEKFVFEMNMQGQQHRSGFDGKTYWTQHGDQAKTPSDDNAVNSHLAMRLFSPSYLFLRNLTDNISINGKTQIDEFECYEAELKDDDGVSQCKYYFDVNDGCLRGSSYMQNNTLCEFRFQFERVEGIRHIKSIDMKLNHETLAPVVTYELKIEAFNSDEEFDATMFEGPDQ